MQLPSEAEVRRRVEAIVEEAASGQMELLGERHEDPIELVETDPAWPARFGEIRDRLRDAIGPAAVRIEHVGSTAVPGIAAKPVIDVQVSVAEIDDERAYAPAIESLGWPMRARERALGHRFFRDPAGVPRRVHIHVCEVGGEWERKHLLFRDYLCAHPERAHEYDALKRELLPRYGRERLAYTEAKGPFIEETLHLAEEWASDTGWSVGHG